MGTAGGGKYSALGGGAIGITVVGVVAPLGPVALVLVDAVWLPPA